LKPIRDDAVTEALAKYRRLEAHFAGRGLEALARALSPRRLLVRKGAGFAPLPVEEIAYFVSQDKLVDVIASDGRRFSVDKTLAEIESELGGGDLDLFRLSRQVLARPKAVAGFRGCGKGRLLVTLAPPLVEGVIVSQENAARFRAWLAG
jgi:DNA-binding LytR/AlgR family response regulator